MKPIDPQAAVDYMIASAPKYAKAKATRIYLEEFRKSKKAILMQNHLDKAIGAQEREVYTNPEYIGILAALRIAVEEEEELRWTLTAAQTRVDVWRSQNASNRQIDKATQ